VAESLNVEIREQTGSLRAKRMRQGGNIPAMLYGHGEGNVMLSVSTKELKRVIDQGNYIVELKGGANGSALIKEVQWDAFGVFVVHVDFTRVDPNEKVGVTLPLEFKGDPVGTRQGGEVNYHQNELSILCPAISVPDKIEVKVGDLDVGQSITAGDVVLPEGAELDEAGTTPIVSCAEKSEAPAEEEADSAAPTEAAPEAPAE